MELSICSLDTISHCLCSVSCGVDTSCSGSASCTAMIMSLTYSCAGADFVGSCGASIRLSLIGSTAWYGGCDSRGGLMILGIAELSISTTESCCDNGSSVRLASTSLGLSDRQ